MKAQYILLLLLTCSLQAYAWSKSKVKENLIIDGESFDLQPYNGVLGDNGNKTFKGHLCSVKNLTEFKERCYTSNPNYVWIVIHEHSPRTTREFVKAFNNQDNIVRNIQGFLIWRILLSYDLGLSSKNLNPQVVSEIDIDTYARIAHKINGSFFNSQGQFFEAQLIHELVTECQQFNYMVFVLTPTIAFAVVLRIAYIWKTNRALDTFSPGRFFKQKETRLFIKRNLKNVKAMLKGMLSFTWLQAVSFLLFYFVCPWLSFVDQTTIERVLTVQVAIIYPISQAFQATVIVFFSGVYMKFRKTKILHNCHLVVVFVSTLIVSLLQISFSMTGQNAKQSYYMGRMWYPPSQLLMMGLSIYLSTKSANLVEEDAEIDQELCQQGKILLFKLQNVIRAFRAVSIFYFVVNTILGIQIILRGDETKLLCYILLVVSQSIMISLICIVLYMPKWINHRINDTQKRKVERKFGKGKFIDENVPFVESVGSSFAK